MRNFFIVAFFFLLFVSSVYADDSAIKDSKGGYILCINSYTEASTWSNRVISVLTEYVNDKTELTLAVEHLEMIMLNSLSELDVFGDYICEHYGDHKPVMVVILGKIAFDLRDRYREMWGDVPIILYNSFDYTGNNQVYFSRRALTPQERVPISDLADKYNVTLMYNNLFIEENVDFIKSRVPGMDTLIFINDSRYVNYEILADLREVVGRRYPEVKVVSIRPDDMNINDLLYTLNNINTDNTAILFSSWFYRIKVGDRYTVVSNTSSLISTCHHPIFTIGLEDIITFYPKMFAGYTYEPKSFKNKLYEVLDMICAGVQPRDIEFYVPEKGNPYVRCDVALSKGISISDFPSDTVFLNRPVSFWSKYKFLIMAVIFFLVVVIIVMTFRMRLKNIRIKAAIADEKRVLEHISKVFNNMPIGYMEVKGVYDENDEMIDYIYLETNNVNAMGSRSKSDFINKKLSDIVGDKVRNELISYFVLSEKEGKIVSKYMFDPEKNKWFNITIVPNDNSGIFDAFLVDATEVMSLKEKAEESNRLKSAFLANMSHEIRTPLNAIVGFSALLAESDDAEEKHQYLSIINANNDLLLRLINDILDLSKIESGTMELKLSTFDMSVEFENYYTTFLQKCQYRNIQLLKHNPYKSCVITIDKNRMLQICMNYLNNALKYTAKGFIKMGYEYKNKGIVVFVQDTGIGVPENKKSLLFRRFQKIDDFAQGTGLGLSICKAIAEVMGGKVGFETEFGKGSIFWAWIPCEAKIEVIDENK